MQEKRPVAHHQHSGRPPKRACFGTKDAPAMAVAEVAIIFRRDIFPMPLSRPRAPADSGSSFADKISRFILMFRLAPRCRARKASRLTISASMLQQLTDVLHPGRSSRLESVVCTIVSSLLVSFFFS